MLDHTLCFITKPVSATDVNIANDEPSHIHIPRPSRLTSSAHSSSLAQHPPTHAGPSERPRIPSSQA